MTYANIRALAPNAKVFVVGYPAIAPDFAHAPTGLLREPDDRTSRTRHS